MNFTDLIKWCIGVVLACSTVSHIDDIHHAISNAQAKLIYESRTETWGSPRFFKVPQDQRCAGCTKKQKIVFVSDLSSYIIFCGD